MKEMTCVCPYVHDFLHQKIEHLVGSHGTQLFLPLLDEVDHDRLQRKVRPIMDISDEQMVVLRRQHHGVYEEDWEFLPLIFQAIDRTMVADQRRLLYHTLAKNLTIDQAYRVLHAVKPRYQTMDQYILGLSRPIGGGPG